MRHSKNSPEGEVWSTIGWVQEASKNSNKQSNPRPKMLEKQQTKPKVSKRKEIIK